MLISQKIVTENVARLKRTEVGLAPEYKDAQRQTLAEKKGQRAGPCWY